MNELKEMVGGWLRQLCDYLEDWLASDREGFVTTFNFWLFFIIGFFSHGILFGFILGALFCALATIANRLHTLCSEALIASDKMNALVTLVYAMEQTSRLKSCGGNCTDCKCKAAEGELSPSEYELFVNREGSLVRPVEHGPDKCGCNGQTQCAERLREQGIVVGEKKDCGGNCADCKCEKTEEKPPAGLTLPDEAGLCAVCCGYMFIDQVKTCPECKERPNNFTWQRCATCAIAKGRCAACDELLDPPGEVFATGARNPRTPETRAKVVVAARCGCGFDCADLGCPGRGVQSTQAVPVAAPADIAFYESDPLSCPFCGESNGRHGVSCRFYVDPVSVSAPTEKKLDKLTGGTFKVCNHCGLYENVHGTWCSKRDPKTDSSVKVACLKCGKVDGHYDGCLTGVWINSKEGRAYAKEKDEVSLEKKIDLVAMSGICSVCRGENGGHKPGCALRDCQSADYVGPTVPKSEVKSSPVKKAYRGSGKEWEYCNVCDYSPCICR